MKKLLGLTILILLVGCASQPIQPLSSIKFLKGGTDADYKRDSYQCEREAMQIPASPYAYSSVGLVAAYAIKEMEEKQREMYIRCMESKGWHLLPDKK